MSEMEYNKGKLIPVDMDELLEKHPQWGDKLTLWDEILEDPEDFDCEIVNGKPYTVQWEHRKDETLEIAKATENEDGTIDFETYHYNGCAHWTEMVEEGLEK